MKGLELLETYPKAGKVIKEYFVDQLLKHIDDSDIPEDFKEFAKQQEIDNDKIAGIIDASPRALFDVFDEHNLNIVIHVYTEEPPTDFGYSIVQHEDDGSTELWSTRKDAEAAAVELAFELLNNKL